MEPQKSSFDPKFAKKYNRHINAGRLICALPPLRALVLKLQALFTTLKKDYENAREDITYNNRPSSIQSMEEQASFDPFLDVRSTINYARQIMSPNFGGPDDRYESHRLYEEQLKDMEHLLENNPDIKGVLNFGICYGHVDALLARKFPDISFVGIDLSKYNKAINEVDFGDIDNLEFVAGDIFNLIKDRDLTGWALFHSRILCKFPLDFVEKLYAAASAAGMSHIVGFEQFGYSRTKIESVTFSETPRPSIYWRNSLLIHNYPQLTRQYGFSTQSSHIFKTAHASPDYRVFGFIAKKTADA